MATKVAGLYVKIDADSAELISELKKSINETKRLGRTVNREANRIKYAFNKLRRAAQVVASAYIFTAFIRSMGKAAASIEKAEERMQLLQARIQQFARSPDSFQRWFDLSQRLGVTIESTAQGMTRLLIATKSIGTAQPILEDIQQNLVVLGRAGGTSAEEMKGAIIQLSQGLASGRLQGEELRSVLENLPLVAMEIAKELDIDIGKIREFAAEGKITGDVIVRALSNIDIKLEDLPQTFSMSIQRMKNEWELLLAALGERMETSGVLDDLANAIKNARVFVGLGDIGEQIAREQEAINNLQNRIADIRENGKFSSPENILAPSVDELERRIEASRKAIDDLLVEQGKLLDLQARRIEASSEVTEKVVPLDPTEVRKLLKIRTDYLLSEMDRLIKESGIEDEEIMPFRMKQYRIAKDTFTRMEAAADQAARNIQDAFADFLFDPFEDGVKGMLKGFLDAVRRMIAELVAADLFGDGSGFRKGFKKILGLASGGPVSAGTPYIVGEEGPELFMPGASGMIIPNHKLGMAGGPSISYQIDARGADEATIIARMVPLLERTVQVTKNEIRRDMSEGRFR